VKFCKDCRFYLSHTFPDNEPECRRPDPTWIDIVTGETRERYIDSWDRNCYKQRRGECGAEAKFFEPTQ
jgi:hypothetical protein